MRRLVVLLVAIAFALPSFAQVKVIDIQTQADTMVFTAVDMETLFLYKGPKGYLIKADSSNMFDNPMRFYLGEDKETTIQSLKDMISLTENDVATQVIVQDSEGMVFYGITASLTNYVRKPTPIKSDRIVIRNSEMSGVVSLKRKAMESLIKYLNQ